MAYSPTTLTPGDTVTIQDVKERVNEFRTELNVTKLTNSSFDDNTLSQEHVARPELIQQGGSVIEVRCESGGLKFMTKPSASLTAIEDDSVLTKATPLVSLPPASTRPENSGMNTILHKRDINEIGTSFDTMVALPGCGLTVNITRASSVVVRFKTIMNNLLNNAVTTKLSDAKHKRQKIWLCMRKPDGTIGIISGGKRTAGATFTQAAFAFRDLHLFGIATVDGLETGEYTFFVVATITKGTEQAAIYGTHMGLVGRTEMSVEWWTLE